MLLVICALKAAPGLMPRDQVEDDGKDGRMNASGRGAEGAKGEAQAAGQRRSVN